MIDTNFRLSSNDDLSTNTRQTCAELHNRLKELMPSQLYHGSESRGTNVATAKKETVSGQLGNPPLDREIYVVKR